MIPVFNIERFAIHDGAGIRTTVFLQGCPMRCEWCANPESQSVGTHIMHIGNCCTGCGRCVEKCPEKCIDILLGKAHINRALCTACGVCTRACLNDALKSSGQMMSCDELLKIILRDREYYETSGGGVTFSGGEAILHIDELIPLLQSLKSEGINIAFETCGCISIEAVKVAMEYADFFLFDIKSLDEEKLKKHTYGSLKTILAALEYICANAAEKIIARVPVLPDFNFHEIGRIMEYAKHVGIGEIHLLPYHTLGMSKYEQLGREYPFSCRTPLDKNTVKKFVPLAQQLGMKVKIGG